MHTIRKRLSILIISCSIMAILLIMLFVNFTINHIFEDYMTAVQNKRYERIVTQLEELYKNEGQWNEISGVEILHEAYMSNYNLTLYNINNIPVWGMNPMDIRNKVHLHDMKVQDQGVYLTKKFELHFENEIVGYVEIGQYSPLLMTDEDAAFKSSVNKSIMMSGIVTIFIIIFVSLYYSKQFSQPITEVSNMSVKLSKGEFKEKTTIKTNIEEIANLRNSINELAEKLDNQNALRKRLVSDISHEVRTPLNVLQNNLEAMIDGIFPVSDERLSHLNDEVIRFGKLLNNLDKLKEFENESMKLNFHKVDLLSLLKNMHKDFSSEAKEKNIAFNFSYENEKYYINGDEDKLKQVFINIIDNAIKFTNKGGEVDINLSKNDDKIIIGIKDTGIGINDEDMPYIFERLYRGDKSRHETEGSGIGLTIVKSILDSHLATIDIKSKEGEGTSVQLRF
ncbi:HAMP domain-containing histidine kinase [Sedimentibacter hydroxybenzoicus DSM 7310]|uniref:histidine kinase n=1 Tax=Sedimentibacter hydroxybenzoicus DSM 7310 TaxID=1123245 RepID=A0A974GX50_SEDHY|nr:HAMP domain-containing sensor histidine kinase [Sedimentibacter hydroxybenzoicus]NYB74901.1 HAMP domain-containing histidine kinase [Sedimentibacter hydroxybenzoicus DSM 7310]